MPEGSIIFVFLAFAAVVIVGIIYNYHVEKKRREALAALAHQLNLTFDPSHDASHDDIYGHFEVFSQGFGRSAYNTLRGSVPVAGTPCDLIMGDFVYKTRSGSGKNRRTQTHRLSYLILHTPFQHAPGMFVRPEGLFDRFAGFMGFDDIDFESEEFSRRFYVKGTDKRFVYDIVHPRMMEFLLQSRPPVVDFEHGRICLLRGRRRWEPQEFHRTLEWVQRFMDLWPEHVTRTLRGTSPLPLQTRGD